MPATSFTLSTTAGATSGLFDWLIELGEQRWRGVDLEPVGYEDPDKALTHLLYWSMKNYEASPPQVTHVFERGMLEAFQQAGITSEDIELLLDNNEESPT